MTRDQAIEKICAYLDKHRDQSRPYFDPRIAFEGNSPMRGALLMLEALGLVKFDDDDEKPG